jgi:plasmid rolling circle replication initiator protein Rep
MIEETVDHIFGLKKPDKRELLIEKRAQLIETLKDEGAHDLAAVLRRCSEPLDLCCVTCGSRKRVETGCRKRWCPVCSRKIAAAKCARYALALRRMQWPLFVTLTVRSRSYAEESVRELVAAFFAFRRRKWWKDCDIKGGIRGVEITHGAGGWHPHLHILMDCEWLAVNAPKIRMGDTKEVKKMKLKAAQKELTEEWANHTGQEISICWVKRADKSTLREVIKYTVDPDDLIKADGWAAEAIRCMRHTRATQAWGSCHGIAAEAKALEMEEKPRCQCPGCEDARFLPVMALLAPGHKATAVVVEPVERFTLPSTKGKSGPKYRAELQAGKEKARYKEAMASKKQLMAGVKWR